MPKSLKIILKTLLIVFLIILAFLILVLIFGFQTPNFRYYERDGVSYIDYHGDTYIETPWTWDGEYYDMTEIGFLFNFPFSFFLMTDDPQSPDYIYIPRGYSTFFREDYDIMTEQMRVDDSHGYSREGFDFTFDDLLDEKVDIDGYGIREQDNYIFVFSYIKDHPFLKKSFMIIYYEEQYYVFFIDDRDQSVYKMNSEYIDVFCNFYQKSFE